MRERTLDWRSLLLTSLSTDQLKEISRLASSRLWNSAWHLSRFCARISASSLASSGAHCASSPSDWDSGWSTAPLFALPCTTSLYSARKRLKLSLAGRSPRNTAPSAAITDLFAAILISSRPESTRSYLGIRICHEIALRNSGCGAVSTWTRMRTSGYLVKSEVDQITSQLWLFALCRVTATSRNSSRGVVVTWSPTLLHSKRPSCLL
eukprot:340196-Rhodomonas_salina.2